MKDMYVLVGAPGVGKSTWTEKEFQGECTVISSDNVLQEIAKLNHTTYDGVFEKYVKVAEKMMWWKFDIAVSENQSPIVVDRTNMTASSRSKIFNRLKTFHKNSKYNIHAVVFIPPDTTEHQRRLDNRPGKTIPKHVVKYMIRSFQMPTTSEGFKSIKVIESN